MVSLKVFFRQISYAGTDIDTMEDLLLHGLIDCGEQEIDKICDKIDIMDSELKMFYLMTTMSPTNDVKPEQFYELSKKANDIHCEVERYMCRFEEIIDDDDTSYETIEELSDLKYQFTKSIEKLTEHIFCIRRSIKKIYLKNGGLLCPNTMTWSNR